ncbi:MAG TPA: tripartite tricarboxylate transporter TctB family protein [Candidatus Limnocylindrales bacterium]|nr:tripartite tricarboxylate transporter TctB family protein [Candidatus Limnocylindrales bacterium]
MGANNNILIGIGTILWGGVVFFLIRDFPRLDDGHPGPALFPGILAGLFIAFGAFLLIQSLRARSRSGTDPLASSQDKGKDLPLQRTYSPQGFLNALCVVAAIAFYIFFVEILGFLITGFLLLTLLMIKLKVPIWKSSIVSLLSTVGVYILFAKILRVPLPWGLLGW